MKQGFLAALIAVTLAAPALAHITPPVVLTSDRDALATLLAGAQRFFVREVRLSAARRDEIAKASGWRPDAEFYRFYPGRDGAAHAEFYAGVIGGLVQRAALLFEAGEVRSLAPAAAPGRLTACTRCQRQPPLCA